MVTVGFTQIVFNQENEKPGVKGQVDCSDNHKRSIALAALQISI